MGLIFQFASFLLGLMLPFLCGANGFEESITRQVFLSGPPIDTLEHLIMVHFERLRDPLRKALSLVNFQLALLLARREILHKLLGFLDSFTVEQRFEGGTNLHFSTCRCEPMTDLWCDHH